MKSLIVPLVAIWSALTGSVVAQVRANPAVLDGAFRPGFTTTIPDHAGPVSLRVVEAGRLKVTSGRVVAADPFVYNQPIAFTFKVPAGEYIIRLAVALLGEDHFRVALARVDFGDAPAVRWEMALVSGQSERDLKDGEIFGYSVDSGTGAFADADAFVWLDKHYAGATGTAFEALSDKWIAEGEAAGPAMGVPNLFLLAADVNPANNIVMYSSGWGDGFYASWVGYDAKGNVMALVTDFAVVNAVDGV